MSPVTSIESNKSLESDALQGAFLSLRGIVATEKRPVTRRSTRRYAAEETNVGHIESIPLS